MVACVCGCFVVWFGLVFGLVILWWLVLGSIVVVGVEVLLGLLLGGLCRVVLIVCVWGEIV